MNDSSKNEYLIELRARIVPQGPFKVTPLFIEKAKTFVKFCYEKGLILLSCSNSGNVIRTMIPLVITDEQLERGLANMEECFSTI